MDPINRQSRLLGRILSRLRGDHSRIHSHATLNSREQNRSSASTAMSDTSLINMEDEEVETQPENFRADDDQHSPRVDYRYSGQYLTPEQLPGFCDQLHNLVEVIRNIQSYAAVTGEYPRELERRLEKEAREVSALAAEARNARDVMMRTRVQRRALHAHRGELRATLDSLRETEMRELESTVRLSDRKLFKSWEALKDSLDPAAFEPLLEEIRNKQTALECLVRLITARTSKLTRAPPRPLPAPGTKVKEDTVLTNGIRRRQETPRRGTKRRRTEREPRSVPVSGESLPDTNTAGTECTSRFRVGSTGAVALTIDIPTTRASVRDIMFFTAD